MIHYIAVFGARIMSLLSDFVPLKKRTAFEVTPRHDSMIR